MSAAQALPYCGAPPIPDHLLERWNLDPAVIVVVVAVAVLYRVGLRREPENARAGQAWFQAGWFLSALVVMSPLCALSVSLFAARIAQHVVLVLVAAPLIALGRPMQVLRCLASREVRTLGESAFWKQLFSPVAGTGLLTVTLWFWQMPGPYQSTFDSTWVYWTMHLSTLAAAVMFWSALFRDSPGQIPQRIVAVVLFSLQMTLLGALIALAPRPLYAEHLFTTWVWGVSPLQDQQLGGLIMWVPGCALFAAVTVSALIRIMRRVDRAYS